jgi:hypothetical protein
MFLLSLLGVRIGSVVVLSSYAVLAGLSVVDGDVLLLLLSLLIYIQGVTGGTDQTSRGCSLC